ncbi:hypothetical protein [Kineosporia succinea]|uniref:Uncharacterized protein n=1 Tax=Kineosporia succinea TaxID=84632 RepID=A0ABT9P1F0_9ACTN|nr:hypothetical protein [Kineosporia succinea]MDP9826244.1 hypothetical protein [Kineosporia succinea]
MAGDEEPETYDIESLEDIDALLGPGGREVTIHSEGGLTVLATLEEGSLVISGTDTDASSLFGEDVSEYEYSITVAPGDVPRVLDALDVAQDLDVLDALVLRGSDLVRIGEAGWLESIGVQAEFWSRIS